MSVLISDAKQNLAAPSKDALLENRLFEILYADDTLLVGDRSDEVQNFAAVIEAEGAKYGMSLHWGKTQVMSVACERRLIKPDGSDIQETGALQYLGSVLTSDGRVDSELSRRIGYATQDFRHLQALWNHACVARSDKLRFFHALIISRLQHGLATMWLVTAQRRRLDGFYARCLRKILRIPSSYISRVSNDIIYTKAGVQPLSKQILQNQLALLGRTALAPAGSPLRRDVFINDTLHLQIGRYVRRIGRPRQDWASQLMKEGAKRLGGDMLEKLLQDRSAGAYERWKSAIFLKEL
jgi:hypothetical protein